MSDILHLVPGAPSWPLALETIPDPPAELWARGRVELFGARARVALVGTRAPTGYGLEQARRFARTLGAAGVVIVSGLARGIDAAAHEGALEAQGDTIAVLGSGVDVPWPSGPLTERIARAGLLCSEYAPGRGPRRHHFPLRNRLISGLSQAVLVVEAAYASGSLITARWAADQGRDVYALPGRVDHPMARGVLRLLREGATPVGSPEELIEDLLGRPAPGGGRVTAAPDEPLLAALTGETRHAAELAEVVGEPLPRVLARLVELEFAGVVARGPGGLYRRCAR